MILQRARNDFRGRRGAGVDQHHDGLAFGDVAALGVIALRIFGMTATSGNHFAAGQKIVRDLDRLIQKAAGIVAQIDDVALDAGADLLLQLAHRLLQARRGLFVEARQPDVTDIAFAPPRVGVHLHHGALQGHVERLLLAFAQNGEGNFRAFRSAHLVDGVVERQARDGGAVDSGDAVAGFDAGLGRGRAVDRRNHFDQPFFLRHFDADAAELALGGDLHVVIGLGVHIAGMWVQARDHALDRGIDEFAVLHGAHIVGAHAFEGVGEQIELTIGARVAGALGLRQQAQRQRRARDPAQCHQSNLFHVPFAFRVSRLSQGFGSSP